MVKESLISPSHDQSADNPEHDRRKRKARFGTACYPCRQRKVKCSYETPCEKCVERGHPESCVYERHFKRANIESLATRNDTSKSPAFDDTKSPWEQLYNRIDGLEQVILELKEELGRMAYVNREDPKSKLTDSPSESQGNNSQPRGIHTNEDFLGETVFLGGNSVPAMVVALANGGDSVQDLAKKSILPIFALDNESATYPFVDLWGLPYTSNTRIEELRKLIPRDTECIELFAYYKDTAHVLFPGIINIQHFESEVIEFLTDRSETRGAPSDQNLADATVHGKSIHWLGLLFAILASGCQCSIRPRKEQQLTSQVYSTWPSVYS
jgi:hypothetical protein